MNASEQLRKEQREAQMAEAQRIAAEHQEALEETAKDFGISVWLANFLERCLGGDDSDFRLLEITQLPEYERELGMFALKTRIQRETLRPLVEALQDIGEAIENK